MIEAFRIGVQMTMDAADTQSVVHLLARDFTALNQQITQTQSGIAAMRAGLSDLAGQRTSLRRDQDMVQQTATWQAVASPVQAAAAQSPPRSGQTVARLPFDGVVGDMVRGDAQRPVDLPVRDDPSLRPGQRLEEPDPALAILPALATLLDRRHQPQPWMADQPTAAVAAAAPALIGADGSVRQSVAEPAVAAWVPMRDFGPPDSTAFGGFAAWPSGHDAVSPRQFAAPLAGGAQQAAQPGETDLRAVVSQIAALTAFVTAERHLPHPRTNPVLPSPPDMFTTRAELGVPMRAGEAEEPPTSRATPDRGSAEPMPQLVIHTDLHLDGQVIARAVTQQIVDWMNAPLPGAGGFDPRRSYTPVES